MENWGKTISRDKDFSWGEASSFPQPGAGIDDGGAD